MLRLFLLPQAVLFLLLPQYVWKIFIAFIYTLIPLYCRIIASSFFQGKEVFRILYGSVMFPDAVSA
jgi:hypothetical protein